MPKAHKPQWVPRAWAPPRRAYVRQHFDGIRWVGAYDDGLWVNLKVEADTEQGAKDKLVEALEKAPKETKDAFS